MRPYTWAERIFWALALAALIASCAIRTDEPAGIDFPAPPVVEAHR